MRLFTRKGVWVGLICLAALATLYAQEPQIFQRGIVILRGNLVMTGITGNQLQFEGATSNDYQTFVTATDPTADRTITLPNESGTMMYRAFSRRAVTDWATALSSDVLIAYTALASSTAPTIKLATAIDNTGLFLIIKNETSGTTTITVAPAAGTSQTIDGGTSARISTAYFGKAFYSNGVNWFTWPEP